MSKNDDLVRRLRALSEAAQKSMDTGGREEVHPFEVQEVCEASLGAIERGAAQGVRVKPLEWEGPFKPGENGSHYDHIYADSALGRYAFEWKSWKDYDSPTSADCPGDFFFSANDLSEAKAAAQADYERRIMSALNPAPPAPAPDAGEPTTYEEICERCGELTTFSTPTPQPPAVEAEAEEPVGYMRSKDNDGNAFWCGKSRTAYYNAPVYSEATLKAKTDEIERLRRECDHWLGQARSNLKAGQDCLEKLEAAGASNKALREKVEQAIAIYQDDEAEDIPLAMFDVLYRALLSETGGE